MHFGEIEVLPVHGGNFYLDGGAMFGVVPKTLWEKKAPPTSVIAFAWLPIRCWCAPAEKNSGGNRQRNEMGS